MKRGTTHGKAQASGRSLDPAIGRIVVLEYIGNFYVRAPSKDVIAMTPIRMVAELIADSLSTSRKRTAVLLRQGWSVGRDGQLFPPNQTVEGRTAKGQDT